MLVQRRIRWASLWLADRINCWCIIVNSTLKHMFQGFRQGGGPGGVRTPSPTQHHKGDIPPCWQEKLKYIPYFTVISVQIGHFKHQNLKLWKCFSPGGGPPDPTPLLDPAPLKLSWRKPCVSINHIDQRLFPISNHHKYLSYLSLLHLKTFAMGLLPLLIYYSFSAGIDIRRQNLTSNVNPRTERVDMNPGINLPAYLHIDLWYTGFIFVHIIW